MSDMIDHLRAISNAAGRDVALQLSDGASIATMAGQVRVGVRRRRIRTGIAAASVATAGVVLALALPVLLRNLPSEPVDPGRSPIHNTGPLTVYDDGSMQVILSSGDFLDVAPDQTGGIESQRWSKIEACMFRPENLPPSGWILDDPSYGKLVSQVRPLLVIGGTTTAVFEGAGYEAEDTGMSGSAPYVKVRVEADPSVAPYLVIQTRWAEVQNDAVQLFGYRMAGNPSYTLEGSADLGTERAVIETEGLDLEVWQNTCQPLPPDRKGTTTDDYLLVDVWLVDRVGLATHIGTYTGSFEMMWKEAS
jgi:hypothetical protein